MPVDHGKAEQLIDSQPVSCSLHGKKALQLALISAE